ncbi:50S ribosomal protein L4 [candidate division WWE3 bacterium]|nr:50S ribosomal protein L4 [candidate division WWE3 bacterium]
MKVNFYTKTGTKKKEQLEISDAVFGIEPNEALLTQYIHIYKTNQRQGTSKVKTRAEVSGGGKKPWRQKGTGRARHGSIRSPIWRGGGIVHGPTPKSWKLNFPKKMRALAIKSALTYKAQEEAILVLETPKFEKPSSKEMAKILSKMDLHGKVLLVQKENGLAVRKSCANISNLKCALVETLNAYEILLAEKIIFTEDALKFLEEKYAN